ncbi:MAG: FAD-dependent thymidylate synthase [Bacilli bacterium]|nr:FAD-dependent thymidylate synthase [Bacilli bacterium]
MKVSNLKVSLLPHTPFLMEDGKFNIQKAMNYQGQLGGICYSEEGLGASFEEDFDKTERRVNMMTSGEHQSVFEHVNVGLYLQNSPKFLNMILNNEHQYSTSERSLRYTSIKEGELPKEMIDLYNKWNSIFFMKIKDQYGHCKSDAAIRKLAQENSRYLMPVTMSTEMVHTIPLAQLHRVVNYLMDYADNGFNGIKDDLHDQMELDINTFICELDNLGLIDERLLSNRKHRSLSIFGQNIQLNSREFGDVYSTAYKGSFAEYAQAHRHRTIYYQMERTVDKDYYIPPILGDDVWAISEWQKDMELVTKMGYIPQGEMIKISEKGTFENFVMKMKERLCSAAQLEVAMQTEETRNEYRQGLYRLTITNNINTKNIEAYLKYKEKMYTLDKYSKGARCTFPDYDCPRDCKFSEGKTLKRKI